MILYRKTLLNIRIVHDFTENVLFQLYNYLKLTV